MSMLQLKSKAQSSIELITAYGWAVALVVVIVGTLVIFIGYPSSIPPNTCSMALVGGGVDCSDVVLVTNQIAKTSSMYLYITNGEPYAVENVIAFAEIGGLNTTPSQCSPFFLSPGDSAVCDIQLKSEVRSTRQLVVGDIFANVTECGLSANFSLTSNSCLDAPSVLLSGVFSTRAQYSAPTTTTSTTSSTTTTAATTITSSTTTTVGTATTTIQPVLGPELYCVLPTTTDGYYNAIYAPVSSSGFGAWAGSGFTSSPVPGDTSLPCTALGSDLYCLLPVSGHSGTIYNAIYAAASGSGIGPWTGTAITSSPLPGGESLSCSAYGSDLYCLLPVDGTGGTGYNAIYAPVSGSGIGPWTGTAITSSQLAGGAAPACSTANGYIYCLMPVSGSPSAAWNVIHAAVSSSGFGPWSGNTFTPGQLAVLPGGVNPACSASGGDLYCLMATSGANYNAVYAPISVASVGSWAGTAFTSSQLDGSHSPSCSAYGGKMYCLIPVGGGGGYIYNAIYAPVSSSGFGAWAGNTFTSDALHGGDTPSCSV